MQAGWQEASPTCSRELEAITAIAVVGAGPWGLAVLDRLIARAKRGEMDACKEVVLIDCQPPGFGVHSPDLSRYLLLNTTTEQVDAFGASVLGEPPFDGALNFLRWLEATGAPDVDPFGFVPRRLYGCYLGRVYQILRRAAQPNLRVRFVHEEVVDIRHHGHEVVVLASGKCVAAQLVFLCTGHGRDPSGLTNPDGVAGWLSPYPTEALSESIKAGAHVGVAGMGLVAVDLITALTEGRGGRFTPKDVNCLQYIESGSEPVIHLFSRAGLPFCCRPVSTLDLHSGYRPAYFTLEAIANQRQARQFGKLDFESDVLPLLFDEMAALYNTHPSKNSTERVFNPREIFYGSWIREASDATSYRSRFLSFLSHDVVESAEGGAGSPYKAGIECFRLLRDVIRDAVEFYGLTTASHIAFWSRIAPRINQLVVGPPLLRGKQLVALIEAGVVRLDLGPGPVLTPVTNTTWVAQSAAFSPPVVVRLDSVVRGFINNSGSVRSNVLFRALKAANRARSAVCDGVVVAEIEVSRAYALIDSNGRAQRSVRVLGLATEGLTYFDHYLPSPGSRSRVFHIIENILDEAGVNGR